ncbi:MAG: hypothetical protein AB8G05_05955 [Oligoflexales bacterium]
MYLSLKYDNHWWWTLVICAFLGIRFNLLKENKVLGQDSTQVLGDRLLMDINHYTFSQRQMEVYLLIKALIYKPENPRVKLNQESWLSSIEKFREDMLIYLETKRLGRFQPPDDKVQNITRDLERRLYNSPNIQEDAKRLGLDRLTLLRTVANVIQVEEYRKLKSMNQEPGWVKSLEPKYVVRSFKGSHKYQKISPKQP